jgi:hypothetical protein
MGLRSVDLGEGERAEDIYDDLHVDLADPFERAPLEGVLVQQLAIQAWWPRRAYSESLESHQPLVAGLEVVTMPNASHAGRSDLDATSPRF